MTRQVLRVPRDEVASGTAVRLSDGAVAVCLVRVGDDFYAIGDACSHGAVSLSEGEVDADSLVIECWMHGSSFSLLDGCPQSLPATKSVPVYEVTLEGDEVVVRS
jgi:3-phenylpropionate/trans-cinnamate dioxygenase ferredoxin subunit